MAEAKEAWWQRDEDVSSCGACGAAFSLTRRKHHCRSCGRIFCAPCSSRTRAVPHRGHSSAVRVCDECDALENTRVAFAARYRDFLVRGAVLVKHNAGVGGTSRRHVRLSERGDAILYGPEGGKKAPKSLPVAELQAVSVGMDTPAFQRSGRPGTEGLCFSVITKDRSLDLEASNERERGEWVDAVRALIALPREGMDEAERRAKAAAGEKERVRRKHQSELSERRADRERKAAEMRKKYGLKEKK